MGNLKDAPLMLTPQVVRSILNIGHAKNMVQIAIEGTVNAGLIDTEAVISAPAEFAARISNVRLKVTPPVTLAPTAPIQNQMFQPTPKGAGSHAPEPVAPKPSGSGVKRKPNWMEVRKLRLDAAIRFLKSQCILVDVSQRSSLVPQYRVSGRRDSMIAEEVIEISIAKVWNESDCAS
jgi:hypothetical protein